MKRSKIKYIALSACLSVGIIGSIIGLSTSDFTLAIATPEYTPITATINASNTLTTDASDKNFTNFQVQKGGSAFTKTYLYTLNANKPGYAPVNIQKFQFTANKSVEVNKVTLKINFIDKTSITPICKNKDDSNTYYFDVNDSSHKAVDGFSIKVDAPMPNITEIKFTYQCF